jgi:hypothetical protein
MGVPSHGSWRISLVLTNDLVPSHRSWRGFGHRSLSHGSDPPGRRYGRVVTGPLQCPAVGTCRFPGLIRRDG